MITLLVSYYAQDPQPAIDSARHWIPSIDHVAALDGRYAGFEPMTGYEAAKVYANEHTKRNVLLRQADALVYPAHAGQDRWLLVLDCDERITYASPQLPRQLEMTAGHVAGCRAIEPLPPDTTALGKVLAGLGQPGRSVRDRVLPMPRLIRHIPGLEYRHRHDFLVTPDGEQLLGWDVEGIEKPPMVDCEYVHLWWDLPEERKNAKAIYYSGPERQKENVAWARKDGAEQQPTVLPRDTEWV